MMNKKFKNTFPEPLHGHLGREILKIPDQCLRPSQRIVGQSVEKNDPQFLETLLERISNCFLNGHQIYG